MSKLLKKNNTILNTVEAYEARVTCSCRCICKCQCQSGSTATTKSKGYNSDAKSYMAKARGWLGKRGVAFRYLEHKYKKAEK